MFDDDAEIVARELEIALTRRDFGRGEKSPMAGIPHHAADGYIARLVSKGYRVAVCEQTSDPALSKGLVDREVIRIVTPGTVIDPAMLAAKRNNFLSGVVIGRDAVGIAYVDITTGEFAVTQFNTPEPELALQQELARVGPAEVLIAADYSRLGSRKRRWLATVMNEKKVTKVGSNGNANAEIPDLDEDEDDDIAPLTKLLTGIAGHVTPYDARYFAEDDARHRLLTHFEVASLEGFGCNHLPLPTRAAGAVLAYFQDTQTGLLQQLTSLDINILQQRQQVIRELLGNTLLQARLTEALKKAGDIERLINRVRQRIATPRDMVALASGLRAAAEIRSCMPDDAEKTLPSLMRIMHRLSNNEDIIQLIERAIVAEPPVSTSEGGVIRPSFSAELDQMQDAAHNGQRWIAELEQRERRRTGINNLKVGYSKGPGYYIEVTNTNVSRVPQDYIRKQTLTNSERYITPDLKEYETLILNAQERIGKLESELFAQLRADIAISAAEQVLHTAHAIAEIDVYLSLAQVAAQYNYCRPQLNEGDTIHIVAGRHAVVEQSQADTPFIPNDTNLSNSDAQIIIITGPNMAGKSTYLRQVALITLLAQIGSYVPAEAATIGLTDRIFTRIGAQDDLATGQSTFMVEMVETANILHHATPRSLVILDEIGRGTSTYDGLSIARAVVEYLHNNKRCGARTLFATHYHELVEVAQMLPRIRCMNVAVTEEGGKVVFLRKIVPGGADRSYGVHVAQLAGIPRPVVHRAEEILAELERKGDAKARRKTMHDMTMPTAWQMTLFATEQHPIVEELKKLAIEELTPIEAIGKLYELQKWAKRGM